jgi:hypothetical protein
MSIIVFCPIVAAAGTMGATVLSLHAASAHIRTAVTHRMIEFPSITVPALAQNGRRDYST